MKISIKSALKSNFDKLRSMDQGQIVHQIGNNLRIYEFGKGESEFVNLSKQNCWLYDFVVSPNSRHIYTAQKINNGVQICSYTLSNERKTFRLSDQPNYLPIDLLESIQLLTDEYESTIVYIVSKTKSEACISLIDMLRNKLVSHGFLTEFNQAVPCSEETYEISICGRNFVRRLKAVDGAWAVEEKLPKKLINTEIGFHLWLPLGRCLMVSKTTAYVVEENDILQSFPITGEDDPIFQVIKIAKGFIFFTQKGKVNLYGEEGEEGLFAQMQELKLSIQKSKVTQIEFNRKSEEIFVCTSDGKFYLSRLEEVSTAGKQNYFNFQEINLNYSQPLIGSLSSTAGQNYCLVSSEKNVELWDLTKLCPTITMDVHNLGQDKVIKSSAINADGHSLCIGFSDRVRFYRILLNKFKQFGQYSLKNTSLIHYSHGGQLVAIIYGKAINSSITIVSTLNLKQVMTFKLGYKPAQVIFNEHDDEVYVSGADAKFISVFQISNKSKKGLLQFDNDITFIRFDYLTKKIMVSTGSEVHLIDSDKKSEVIIKPEIPNFDYVFPLEGAYIATDRKGGLYSSTTPEFTKFQYIPLFLNERFHLIYRNQMLIAYTTPANVMVLKVKPHNSNDQANKAELFENIVLVEKDEVNKFFDKVKLLEGQLDQLQTSTAMKLDEERKKYMESIEAIEEKFKQEIEFTERKLAEMKIEKSRQQKSNAKVFEELETGQIKSVNDLQKIYDLKLKLQKEKALTLQQQNLEQKMKYENMIKGLEQKHNNDIEKVRKEYSEKLTRQIKSMQIEKERHIEYKKKVETKMIDLEEEGEMALFQIQMNKDGQIKSLSQRYTKLERQFDSKMIALHNMEEQMEKLRDENKDSEEKIKRNEKIVQENINKVVILEKELEKKNRIIEEKNVVIEQQAHQIDGLEKAKYVLSFRTTEVRKELEPKELLIEKLKNQMFKLDEEYKSEVKKNFQLNQRLQKLQKISLNYKKQNSQIKTQLKNKERTHNDLCSQIFYLVNGTDAKEWNSSLVKIYQNYIKEDKIKLKGQKKDDFTSEEINRHLIHVEQSLHQVASGNQKMLKGKEQEVVRKMKENAELVYDLNIMRKKENQYLNDIKEKNTEISRLKRELNESGGHKSTRANTANTGMTRRLASRDAVNQSDWVDLSIKRPSDYLLPDTKNKNKGRVFSAHKTMVWREENRRQKSKISDLARELQSAKNTIMRQDRMIEELNQRLLGIPEEHLV